MTERRDVDLVRGSRAYGATTVVAALESRIRMEVQVTRRGERPLAEQFIDNQQKSVLVPDSGSAMINGNADLTVAIVFRLNQGVSVPMFPVPTLYPPSSSDAKTAPDLRLIQPIHFYGVMSPRGPEVVTPAAGLVFVHAGINDDRLPGQF